MAHPSDDELESMARAVERHESLHIRKKAAAMLRACKGRVRVKPLEWEDFDGMGAKASGFYQANYLITAWRGRGQFEVAMSYPGYQTGYDGERFHDTLESAKAAAQADYERRILAAIELAPDHETWNAAIEAAAKKAERRFEQCERNNTPPCYLRKCAIGNVLRALKKGPSQ